jgi:glycosyltransferase involved in cell wall biosynthesis
LRGIPFRLIFNYLFSKASRVVSLGGRLTEILERQAGKDKVVVLPNAVNVPNSTTKNFNSKPLSFLFVGRFAFNKGIDVLIDTAELLNKEGFTDAFEFSLVGKGPLWDHYAQNRQLPNLKYLGFANDDALNELYKTCDVFVLPTLFEGMPTVVLEAMAHGMPIIVTDVGATLEMVGPENGFIIEKKSVASLAQAIRTYHKLDVSERKSLSINSYQKVNANFTWKIVAAKHLSLFKQFKT